jgi:hypothetical protein
VAGQHVWERDLPDGTYLVTLVCGDTESSSGPHKIIVEGIPIVDGVSSETGEMTYRVQETIVVADGKLTIEAGGLDSLSHLNYLKVQKQISIGHSGTPKRFVVSVQNSPEHPYPEVYHGRVSDFTDEAVPDLAVKTVDASGSVLSSEPLSLTESDKPGVYDTEPIIFFPEYQADKLADLPEDIKGLFGGNVELKYRDKEKAKRPIIQIINNIVPTKGDPGDSDDCYVVGEGADMNPEGSPEDIVISYSLSEDVDKVSMNVDWSGSVEDLFFGTPLKPLPGNTAGTHQAIWNGRDRFGHFITDPEDGLVRVAIIAEKDGNKYSDAIILYELSSYFKPDIHLQATEFSPPVSIDIMLKHSRLFNSREVDLESWPGGDIPISPYYIDPAPDNIEALHESFDVEQYYLDLHDPSDGDVYDDYPENWRKRGLGGPDGKLAPEETPTVYTHAVTRTVTEDGTDRTLVFIQYWMFYPSSTAAIGKNGNASPTTKRKSGKVSFIGENSLTVNDASWETNELIGSTVGIGYNNDFKVGTVVSNTADTVVVDRNWLPKKHAVDDSQYEYIVWRNAEDKTFHEGDWEMAMSVIELDLEEGVPWLRSMTASQHYTGQTLPTKTGRFKKDFGGILLEPGVDYVQTISDRFPQLFIGGGSHATFFKEGYFGTSNPIYPCSSETWSQVYKDSGIKIDSTTPLKFVSGNWSDLKITPFDHKITHWKGFWGKSSSSLNWLFAIRFGNEPSFMSHIGSPAYRHDYCDLEFFSDGIFWHNKYIRNGHRNTPPEQFFVTVGQK